MKLLFVLLVALLSTVTSCKARQMSQVQEAEGRRLETSRLPPSLAGKMPPFGKMPGAIIGITTDSWGKYPFDALSGFRAQLGERFKGAVLKNGKPGFFMVVVINASAVGGLAGRFKAGKIKRQAADQMETSYLDLEAAPTVRMDRSAAELERYLLIVNDEDKSPDPRKAYTPYYTTFQLPYIGGVILSADQRVVTREAFVSKEDDAQDPIPDQVSSAGRKLLEALDRSADL